jgi:5-methylcytosine-specific restriction enzyme A
MATFLITWNPTRFPWRELDDIIATVRDEAHADDRWSCGNNKSILPGDRLFLMKQGKDEPGLIGSGWATTAVFEDDHWEDAQSSLPRRTRYIDMRWDALQRRPVISRDVLLAAPYDLINWTPKSQGSQSSLRSRADLRWNGVSVSARTSSHSPRK